MTTTTEANANDNIARVFRAALDSTTRDYDHYLEKIRANSGKTTVTGAIESFAEQTIEHAVKYTEWTKIVEILDKASDTPSALNRVIDHVRTRQAHLLRHQPWAQQSSRPFTNVVRQLESAALARVLEQIADMAVWAKGELESKPTRESR